MTSFLGDSPIRVALRLLLLSLVVGWLLNWLDLTPVDLVAWSTQRIGDIWNAGITGFGRFGDTILLGAVVVVPVFFISRLLSYRRG